MVIPEPWADRRMFYERLKDPITVRRQVWSHPVTFLVEPIQRGCVHACTIDDIIRILEHIPRNHLLDLKTIVLRQPTRKQSILSAVWGRLVYWANIGRHSGPTIILEAQDPTTPIRLSHSLGPAEVAELRRLEEDGHRITQTKRHYLIETTLEATRATQLYRTLPHEVGHYAHFIINVRQRWMNTEDLDEKARLEDAYWAKPQQEKEAFAQRYADELRDKLKKSGLIPFERLLGGLRSGRDGLRRECFGDR